MSKLKPCPFCGGNAVLECFLYSNGFMADIQCGSSANLNAGDTPCLLTMTTVTYDTEEEAIQAAIKAWNRRDGE